MTFETIPQLQSQQTASPQWMCCQIGARQHYTVPLCLHRRGVLDSLVTDIWFRPNSLPARMNRNLSGRFHPELEGMRVHALNHRALAFEAVSHLRGLNGWELIEARNEWFQEHVLGKLVRYEKRGGLILHSFSYAGRRFFEFARDREWVTVMQQIDPGPLEDKIVSQLYEANPEFRLDWDPASRRYWDKWREECALADRIVVNSTWSREALKQEGVPDHKLHVIPLSYEASSEANAFVRIYPRELTAKRPLRVLFLGQIELRKGVFPLLEATELLRREPIEFWFAGPMRVNIPEKFKDNSAIRWFRKV